MRIPRVDIALGILSQTGIKATSYLDIGCGNGEITKRIAEIVDAEQVYVIDLDEKALEKAKDKRIKVQKADVSRDKIPLNNENVDLVTAFKVIEHLLNPEHMLREIIRVLKPKGYFALSILVLGIALLGVKQFKMWIVQRFYLITAALRNLRGKEIA